MRLVEHPELVANLPAPTESAPWRILVSGCLAAWQCGVEGTDYGLGVLLRDLLALPTVVPVPFCPEDFGMGTPRTMPDIHGGDGFAVLNGTARVLDEHGTDLTDAMIAGARAMLETAQRHQVHLAILTDVSAACGSQVISDGCRFDSPRRHQRGVGVATAMLLRAGISVVSQRDHKTVGTIRRRLDPAAITDPDALDHHETAWVLENLPL